MARRTLVDIAEFMGIWLGTAVVWLSCYGVLVEWAKYERLIALYWPF